MFNRACFNYEQESNYILTTYLSKPRLFKRSDALIKEAAELGLERVTFEIGDYQEKQKSNLIVLQELLIMLQKTRSNFL